MVRKPLAPLRAAKLVGQKVDVRGGGNFYVLTTVHVYELECGHRTARPWHAVPSKKLRCKKCPVP